MSAERTAKYRISTAVVAVYFRLQKHPGTMTRSLVPHPVGQANLELRQQHGDCGGVVHARQALPDAVPRARAEGQEAPRPAGLIRRLPFRAACISSIPSKAPQLRLGML